MDFGKEDTEVMCYFHHITTLTLLFVSQSTADPLTNPVGFSTGVFPESNQSQHSTTTTLVHVFIIFLSDDFRSFLIDLPSFTSPPTEKLEF